MLIIKQDYYLKLQYIRTVDSLGFIFYDYNIYESVNNFMFDDIEVTVIINWDYLEIVKYNLRRRYYFKFMPEFFFPEKMQIFIFRMLFFKFIFFWDTLYHLRRKTYKRMLKRFFLKHAYTFNAMAYFRQSNRFPPIEFVEDLLLPEYECKDLILFVHKDNTFFILDSIYLDFFFFDFILL